MFKLEQQEYQKEQIKWEHINFLDNQATIDVIEKRPICIFSLLDQESILPKGNENNFLANLQQRLNNHPSLLL